MAGSYFYQMVFESRISRELSDKEREEAVLLDNFTSTMVFIVQNLPQLDPVTVDRSQVSKNIRDHYQAVVYGKMRGSNRGFNLVLENQANTEIVFGYMDGASLGSVERNNPQGLKSKILGVIGDVPAEK